MYKIVAVLSLADGTQSVVDWPEGRMRTFVARGRRRRRRSRGSGNTLGGRQAGGRNDSKYKFFFFPSQQDVDKIGAGDRSTGATATAVRYREGEGRKVDQLFSPFVFVL